MTGDWSDMAQLAVVESTARCVFEGVKQTNANDEPVLRYAVIRVFGDDDDPISPRRNRDWAILADKARTLNLAPEQRAVNCDSSDVLTDSER